MRLLVDTNRYAAIVGRNTGDYAAWQCADEVWLSLITVGELLAGFAAGARRRENEERLDLLLNVQGVGVLQPDLATARWYAQINADLKRQGSPIPTNDIWIAAAALQHNLTLDTRDEHFRKVPGLKLWRD